MGSSNSKKEIIIPQSSSNILSNRINFQVKNQVKNKCKYCGRQFFNDSNDFEINTHIMNCEKEYSTKKITVNYYKNINDNVNITTKPNSKVHKHSVDNSNQNHNKKKHQLVNVNLDQEQFSPDVKQKESYKQHKKNNTPYESTKHKNNHKSNKLNNLNNKLEKENKDDFLLNDDEVVDLGYLKSIAKKKRHSENLLGYIDFNEVKYSQKPFEKKLVDLKHNLEALKIDWRDGSSQITVNRSNILESSMKELQKINFYKELKINFEGEVNYDAVWDYQGMVHSDIQGASFGG